MQVHFSSLSFLTTSLLHHVISEFISSESSVFTEFHDTNSNSIEGNDASLRNNENSFSIGEEKCPSWPIVFALFQFHT